MKKIIGIIATIVGCLLVAIGITIGVEYLDNRNIEYETQTYTLDAGTKLEISADVANVRFVYEDSDKLQLSYYTSSKLLYAFAKEVDTVKIASTFSRYWFSKNTLKSSYFDLVITGPYQNLEMNIVTGSVNIDSYQTESANIITTNADISISQSTMNELTIKNTTGDIELANSSLNNVNIDGITTDIYLNEVDGTTFESKVTTGEVQFIAAKYSDYKMSGVTCDISFQGEILTSFKGTTTTGDIILRVIGNAEEFFLTGQTTVGNVNFDESSTPSGKLINLRSTTGDISVTFTNESF